MKAYLIKNGQGGYLSCSSIQSTKNKYLALYSERLAFERAERFGMTVETIELKLGEKVIMGKMGFGVGDTYSMESVEGIILHETNRYVYIAPLKEDGSPILSRTEKHKKADINTIDFKTCKGYKPSIIAV